MRRYARETLVGFNCAVCLEWWSTGQDRVRVDASWKPAIDLVCTVCWYAMLDAAKAALTQQSELQL